MGEDGAPQPEEGNASNEQEVATKEPASASVADGAAAGGDDDGKKKKKFQRDDTPIEELFDLTKPIPREEKPNKDEYEAELKAIEDTIEELKKERVELQTKIDDHVNSNSNSAASQQKEAQSELRQKKTLLINEKRGIRNRLNAIKARTDKLMEERKAVKSGVKFTKVEDIDAEIRKMQRRQETTSMSLQEEKRLIKEMDLLQKSKQSVAEMKGKEEELDNSKELRKQIMTELRAKDEEIDAIQKEIEERQGVISSLSEKDKDYRDTLKGYFGERDKLREDINNKYTERNKHKDDFREQNNKWYSYQRAVRAQRKIQYEEEARKKEEEHQEYLKKIEEEELKKIPYEEEQALCEYLAKYLTTTYLDPQKKESGEEEKDEAAKDAVVPPSDDPFAKFKPVQKKKDDVFLQMGKGKKPRKRESKQKKKQDKQAPFKLNMDTFDQFGLIGLTPPMSLDAVPKSVEDLVAKKEWYSKQPRGSVPTATQIRKENQKAAQQLKGSAGTKDSSANGKKKASSKFSLSTDDFAPLGAVSGGTGGSGVFNSSWGQAKEAAASPDVTPAEAAAAEEGS